MMVLHSRSTESVTSLMISSNQTIIVIEASWEDEHDAAELTGSVASDPAR
jgi:hypothetical protein